MVSYKHVFWIIILLISNYIDTAVKFHKKMLIYLFSLPQKILYEGFISKISIIIHVWGYLLRMILFIGMFWKKNGNSFCQNMGNEICQCCSTNKYCSHGHSTILTGCAAREQQKNIPKGEKGANKPQV